ncbi:MAG: DUF1294 domain-containing protein [Agathobacter sp.]|nr:DUF1294 domain-containing protein [Agathobacter sp.]MBQ6812973.1 DUF1294 domain-containing protein [Agathobacter sp.]
MEIVMIYLVVANLCGFLAMGLDKEKAKRGEWRIPEKTLFGIALFGGGIGVWFGMNTFRHKTKHWYFKYGIPAIVFAELFLASYLDFWNMK